MQERMIALDAVKIYLEDPDCIVSPASVFWVSSRDRKTLIDGGERTAELSKVLYILSCLLEEEDAKQKESSAWLAAWTGYGLLLEMVGMENCPDVVHAVALLTHRAIDLHEPLWEYLLGGKDLRIDPIY